MRCKPPILKAATVLDVSPATDEAGAVSLTNLHELIHLLIEMGEVYLSSFEHRASDPRLRAIAPKKELVLWRLQIRDFSRCVPTKKPTQNTHDDTVRDDDHGVFLL